MKYNEQNDNLETIQFCILVFIMFLNQSKFFGSKPYNQL